MATLSRKFLSTLGIDEDKADAIIETYQSVLTEIKAERDKYKEEADSIPELKKQIESLEGIAKDSDSDSLKAELESIKAEYQTFKDGITAKEAQAKKEEAFKGLLKDAGVSDKRFASILKVSDLSDLAFDDDGNVTDKDARIESIKNEWGDFITTTHTEGTQTATPPTGKGTTTMTREQIRAIKDPVQRQNAMMENPSLFGLSEE